ncbi:MAG TPA: asparagine synthase (glutamine-hydrolyzing) [bacterium]|nr:asparagine synthase (glutamine-hydrolyzing) [bacterium]
MCGIFGYTYPKSDIYLRRMADTIIHRGPDEEGFYSDKNINLGIRRLSIIDIKSGQQPIYNEKKNIITVYNGEIYNYLILKDELLKKGHIFRTNCDTEVIVHLYEEYGIDFVNKLNGMFAIALYDKNEKILYLIRDRIGIKPLYYNYFQNKLIFGSEIKTILVHQDVKANVNIDSIPAYLTLRYVPTPYTLFDNILKLPAGNILRWKKNEIKIWQYWSPLRQDFKNKSFDECLFEFGNLFEDSVKIRMMSEVPLGAYLSAGIDSNAVVSVMSRNSNKPIEVFTIGFGGKQDEINDAEISAKYMNCNFNRIIFDASYFSKLEEIIWHFDEPVGDAHIIPTYMLAGAAAKKLTVILIGEGSDESLLGYPFHKIIKLLYFYKKFIPKFLNKTLAANIIEMMPLTVLNLFFKMPTSLGNKGKQKIKNIVRKLDNASSKDLFLFFTSVFEECDLKDLILQSSKNKDALFNNFNKYDENNLSNIFNNIFQIQLSGWLQDNILLRHDKMSMAHSTEIRVPFLDYRLVEYLYSVPIKYKLHGLTDKYLLRKYAEKFLPKKIVYRPKKPFFMPLENFLDNIYFEKLIKEYLNESTIKKQGYFNYDYIKQLIGLFKEKDFLVAKEIFALLAFEVWHKKFIE